MVPVAWKGLLVNQVVVRDGFLNTTTRSRAARKDGDEVVDG